jgi:hypothetical protein
METKEAFESLGGRKFFGLVVLALLMTVVAVFAKSLTVELSGGLVALYVAFVGGNSFTTVKSFATPDEVSQEPTYQITMPDIAPTPPQQDMQPFIDAINGLQAQVDEAKGTADQAGNAVLQMNQQLQALKNLTAAALKTKQ